MDREITGVYNESRLCTVRRNTQREPNVERITPQSPLRRRVEVEDVGNDDEDEETNEICHAPHVEGSNDHVDEQEGEKEKEAPRLGGGGRLRTPTNFYQADFTKIRYKYRNEADVIHTCFQGTGYATKNKIKEGFIIAAAQIDSLIDENSPPV